MITIGKTATLSDTFVRIFPADGAFTPIPDEPPAPAPDAAPEAHAKHREAMDEYKRVLTERSAAFERYHETGDESLLAPYAVPGRKPTQFVLRHFRGLLDNALGRIVKPTLGADGEPTGETWAVLCHMSIAKIVDWDGPPLQWQVIKGGSEGFAEWTLETLSAANMEQLATVPGLVRWIGQQALEARTLRPL